MWGGIIMKTRIICILDRSSSMFSIIDESIDGFNTFLLEQQKINSKQDTIKIIFFDSVVNTVYDGKLNALEPFNEKTYTPRGTTALYDGIGNAIDDELDFLAEDPMNRVDKTLVVILTDGEENSSVIYHQQLIKRKIKEMEEEFSWKFIFLAANQDAVFTAQSFGISSGSALNFTADSDGVANVYHTISKATTHYRTTTNEDYSNILKDNE
jgi:uncharacterized protein YegL